MAQEFDLGSVRGIPGIQGPEGPEGPRGPKGPAGMTPSLQIGSVSVGEAGSTGNVIRRADSPDEKPVLDFVLPASLGDMAKNIYDPRNMHQDIFTYVDVYGGRKPATVVVAAADSIGKEKADLICSGVSDQLVLQEAADMLPEHGGSVLLLEGTYCLDGSTVSKINGRYSLLKATKNNTVIRGQGRATKLVFAESGVPTDGTVVMVDFYAGGGSVSDLAVYGKSGIEAVGISFSADAGDCTVSRVFAEGFTKGICMLGGGSYLTDCVIRSCTLGAELEGGNSYVSGLQVENCSDKGIRCVNGSFFLVNNRVKNCGVCGLYLDQGQSCSFAGNILVGNPVGISIHETRYSTVHDNVIQRKENDDTYAADEAPISIHDSVWICMCFNLMMGKEADEDSNGMIKTYYDGYDWNLI